MKLLDRAMEIRDRITTHVNCAQHIDDIIQYMASHRAFPEEKAQVKI